MRTDQQKENKNIVYEIGCLFVPIISDKDVLAEVSVIKSSLEKFGCNFLSGDGPNLKELSYPMKKIIDGEKHFFTKAYFVWLKFIANTDKLVDLKKDLDENKNILRYILVKTVEKDSLTSNQRKVFSRTTGEKEKKVIKPAKIVKIEDPLVIKITENEEIKGVEEKDLDDKIDKLVIK